MFSVSFETFSDELNKRAYLTDIKRLSVALRNIEGYIGHTCFRALNSTNGTLVLSTWGDEKSLVRWRTHPLHFTAQSTGRQRWFDDYRVRVGQITRDTQPPQGYKIQEQRLDETEVGRGTTFTQIHASLPPHLTVRNATAAIAGWMGLDINAPGLVEWKLFESVDEPGRLLFIILWGDEADAKKFEYETVLPEGARVQRVRIIRDYGKFDRRESPQYFPDAMLSDPSSIEWDLPKRQ
ncbi:antibiotic biosynthesis monooxygenase [Pseudomonas sp. RC10]|uniref:antibiotic biosynthesis monooxygenase family protein n=1 Tax=Pseudomonas bambusae TaxID=3139142 RepID=UPI003139EB24